MDRISLLIVDDHPVVRDGLVAMLSTVERFQVVGEAASGTDAARLAARLLPDVALVDLELPPTDGIRTIKEILACSSATKILVFTAFKNEERVMGALQAGAHGYLLKGTPRAQLFEAIEAVRAGKSSFQNEIAQTIVRHYRERDREVLTERQRQIVQLLARGLSNKEMAATLHITERTIKYHLAAIFDRLGVGNRTEALVAAMRMNLVQK